MFVYLVLFFLYSSPCLEFVMFCNFFCEVSVCVQPGVLLGASKRKHSAADVLEKKSKARARETGQLRKPSADNKRVSAAQSAGTQSPARTSRARANESSLGEKASDGGKYFF